jgi:hypothetical protein
MHFQITYVVIFVICSQIHDYEKLLHCVIKLELVNSTDLLHFVSG